MLVYHLLSARHALDDLTHRRLKIATFDDLNDPFELSSVYHPDRRARRELRAFKVEMSRRYGMLCFSGSWHHPLLWSHYADKHRGMALAFNVDDSLLKAVKYVTRRSLFKRIDEQTAQDLLYAKFKDWQYEQETRIFTNLQDRDAATGFYFESSSWS